MQGARGDLQDSPVLRHASVDVRSARIRSKRWAHIIWLKHQGWTVQVGRRGYHTARVCSWMDVLRTRCGRKLTTGCLSILQKLQTLCNGNIAGIKLCCTGICVDGVRDLIVAAFVQVSKIKPDFGDIGIDHQERHGIG